MGHGCDDHQSEKTLLLSERCVQTVVREIVVRCVCRAVVEHTLDNDSLDIARTML